MVVFRREWAMPDSRTFSIPPIHALVSRLCHEAQGGVIVDPFANGSLFGTVTNDLNPEFDTTCHADALEFLKGLESDSAQLILYDPPYSLRQASECYKSFGRGRLSGSVTNQRYWSSCKGEVARVCAPGGRVACFGWNSNGIGLNRGFHLDEVLLVAHGGGRNDTICTVETKCWMGGLF